MVIFDKDLCYNVISFYKFLFIASEKGVACSQIWHSGSGIEKNQHIMLNALETIKRERFPMTAEQ